MLCVLTTFNNDWDLLNKVITGDESWVYVYDIETKTQSTQWKRPEEPRLLLMDVGMSFGSCQSIFCGCFRHETCGSVDCSIIAKFWAKTTSHGQRSWDIVGCWQSRFAQKDHNWWLIMAVWLRPWNQRKRPEEPRPKKSTLSSTKCKDFAHCFLRFQ